MLPSFLYSLLNTQLLSRLGLMRPEAVWLLPARVFIAIGWLRACAEKLSDPHWSSGETLKVFLEMQQSVVVFPFYHFLVQNLFMPYAREVAFVVLLGQWLVGLGILFGAWTRVALLAGLFMNLNFILMGRPDPNVFYMVIQWILLLARAERVFSIDVLLRPQKEFNKNSSFYWWASLVLMILSVMMIPFIQDFRPAQTVKDSAAVLMVLFAVMGFSTLLMALQEMATSQRRITQDVFDKPKDSRPSEFIQEAARF